MGLEMPFYKGKGEDAWKGVDKKMGRIHGRNSGDVQKENFT